ncbi:MAG: hypothetical protein FWB78_09815 [Treponema sp.]|nr:hypothetical protein [Treponema sp.]
MRKPRLVSERLPMLTEVLSQDEIDQLLTAINARDEEPEETGGARKRRLEKYLSIRFEKSEELYGRFGERVFMRRFFDEKGSDEVLADIEQKNREQGMGNYKIPNTNISLINYSLCPKCNTVFSFKDLKEYYAKPKPDPVFKNNNEQFRNDTRVYCYGCQTYFLPSLVIVDGTPKNEVQYLCRMQTVEAIEKFYAKKGRKVLTTTQRNVVRFEKGSRFLGKLLHTNGVITTTATSNRAAILNDVLLDEMQERPSLISNLIQYTPADLAINMLEGTNVEKGDYLFGRRDWIV